MGQVSAIISSRMTVVDYLKKLKLHPLIGEDTLPLSTHYEQRNLHY